jgi:hypothetical protein
VNNLAREGLRPEEVLWRCLLSSFLLALIAQVAIAFNELYDFRISMSRFDRASRFVSSTGTALLASLALVVLARVWHLQRVLDFPGLGNSQLVQTLVFTMLIGFALLYLWRNAFHFALRRWNFNERVLLLGAGQAARSLAEEMLKRSDAGYELVALIPEAEAGPQARSQPAERRSDRAAKVEFGLGDTALAYPAQFGSPRENRASVGLLLQPVQVEKTSTSLLAQLDAPATPPLTEPLFDLVGRLHIDVVVVALQDRRGNLPTDELLRCRLAGIAVKEREAIYEHITGKLAVESMRPSYLIFNDGFARTPSSEIAKRFVDVLFAGAGIYLRRRYLSRWRCQKPGR